MPLSPAPSGGEIEACPAREVSEAGRFINREGGGKRPLSPAPASQRKSGIPNGNRKNANGVRGTAFNRVAASYTAT